MSDFAACITGTIRVVVEKLAIKLVKLLIKMNLTYFNLF